jgi:hypothetical protein
MNQWDEVLMHSVIKKPNEDETCFNIISSGK